MDNPPGFLQWARPVLLPSSGVTQTWSSPPVAVTSTQGVFLPRFLALSIAEPCLQRSQSAFYGLRSQRLRPTSVCTTECTTAGCHHKMPQLAPQTATCASQSLGQNCQESGHEDKSGLCLCPGCWQLQVPWLTDSCRSLHIPLPTHMPPAHTPSLDKDSSRVAAGPRMTSS